MPGPKWTTLQVSGQQKSEAIHLMSTGGLSNGQLHIHRSERCWVSEMEHLAILAWIWMDLGHSILVNVICCGRLAPFTGDNNHGVIDTGIVPHFGQTLV